MNGTCTHLETEPVELAVTGEVVALLCKVCGDQLPANFVCPDCEREWVWTAEKLYPVSMVTLSACPTHA